MGGGQFRKDKSEEYKTHRQMRCTKTETFQFPRFTLRWLCRAPGYGMASWPEPYIWATV